MRSDTAAAPRRAGAAGIRTRRRRNVERKPFVAPGIETYPAPDLEVPLAFTGVRPSEVSAP